VSAADKRKTGNTGDNAGGQKDIGRGQWPPYAPYLVLAAMTLFFFWDLFSPGARHWLWEDVLYFTHPARMFAAYCFSLGKFPFWNPFVFGGQPFFADIQTAVLYPFNLFHSFLTNSQGGGYLLLEIIEALHYFLAALFTFRFLRLTGADRHGSALGGIVFAFSGYLVTHVIHTNFIFVFIWLPLVLELLERSLNSGRFRHVLGCTAALAVSTAGGYPQFTLYIYYTLALYWLVFEIFANVTGGRYLKASLRRVLTLGFITAAALGTVFAIALFLREQIRFSVIRRRVYGNQVFSKKNRLQSEHQILAEKGERTLVIELQGQLFFGTTDQLYTEIEPCIGRCRYFILDMRRVLAVDFTAANMLTQIKRNINKRGGTLIFSSVPRSVPTGQNVREYLEMLGFPQESGSVRFFHELDDALEWIEDTYLLEAELDSQKRRPLKLGEFEFFAGISDTALETLEK